MSDITPQRVATSHPVFHSFAIVAGGSCDELEIAIDRA